MLGRSKGGTCFLAVQAQHAPTGSMNHQCGTQLVAQGNRLQNLAIAPTAGQVAPRAFVETPDVVPSSGQVHKLVGVVLQEQRRLTEQDVIGHGASKQERRRIRGGKECGVNGDDALQDPQHLVPKGSRIQSHTRASHDVLVGPLHLARHCEDSLSPVREERNPSFLRWRHRKTGPRVSLMNCMPKGDGK